MWGCASGSSRINLKIDFWHFQWYIYWKYIVVKSLDYYMIYVFFSHPYTGQSTLAIEAIIILGPNKYFWCVIHCMLSFKGFPISQNIWSCQVPPASTLPYINNSLLVLILIFWIPQHTKVYIYDFQFILYQYLCCIQFWYIPSSSSVH